MGKIRVGNLSYMINQEDLILYPIEILEAMDHAKLMRTLQAI